MRAVFRAYLLRRHYARQPERQFAEMDVTCHGGDIRRVARRPRTVPYSGDRGDRPGSRLGYSASLTYSSPSSSNCVRRAELVFSERAEEFSPGKRAEHTSARQRCESSHPTRAEYTLARQRCESSHPTRAEDTSSDSPAARVSLSVERSVSQMSTGDLH
ncbi:uncharacterized protein LOC117282198 [Cryptotermes secundus]|uniref:uncharacterized protein LOC117282198 n=1 Tax=Cryptotermes secundus TaxID=105785 RepID=UPI001454E3ED|nr:uncharacterized protein LOC117282198 [Cryptotermes secundus]